jgi:hypothetical protein
VVASDGVELGVGLAGSLVVSSGVVDVAVVGSGDAVASLVGESEAVGAVVVVTSGSGSEPPDPLVGSELGGGAELPGIHTVMWIVPV